MMCSTGAVRVKEVTGKVKYMGVLPPGRAFRYQEHPSAHRAF